MVLWEAINAWDGVRVFTNCLNGRQLDSIVAVSLSSYRWPYQFRLQLIYITWLARWLDKIRYLRLSWYRYMDMCALRPMHR